MTNRMTREDRIYLGYLANKRALEREGLDRIHARALLFIAEAFSISPLLVDKIVRGRQ